MKELLGMNKSTAQNRLVKDILFSFIESTNINICFQCGIPMDRDTFSIEHKKPWRNENNALELFFDLDNIAYSHNDCNTNARRIKNRYTTDEERLAARKKSKIKSNAARAEREKIKRDNMSESELRYYKLALKQKRREKYLRTGK